MWTEKEYAEVERKEVIPSGNTVTFRQLPPFGFWKISFEHGSLPKTLSGQYTSYQQAKGAWDAYYKTQPQLQKPSPKERLKEALKD